MALLFGRQFSHYVLRRSISPYMNVSRSVYMAETRGCPDVNLGGTIKTARNKKEAVDRMTSLLALTKNVAYAWHEEDRMGSIDC